MTEYQLNNIDETTTIGKIVGQTLVAGDCLVLTGELGTGKTALTKGIALGLDIEQMIKSPTYTIVREYHQGRLPLYHMDVYRIEDGGMALGLEEYFEGDGVSIVEWGNQVLAELPNSYLEITLNYTTQENQRLLAFKPVGTPSIQRCQEIEKKIKECQ